MKHTLLIAGLALASLTGALNAQNILTYVEAKEARKVQAQAAVAQVEAELAAANAALAAARHAAGKLTPPGTVDPALVKNVQRLNGVLAGARSANVLKFEDTWTPRLGAGWREVWRNSALEHPNHHLVDRYVAGNEFSLSDAEVEELKLPPSTKQAWLMHIGNKATLTEHDFNIVQKLKTYHPLTAARDKEFVDFTPAGVMNEDYFIFHTLSLMGRNPQGRVWQTTLRADEWFTLAQADAHFSPVTFTVGRERILMRAAKLLIKKRKAANLSDSGPEFEAALAPVIAALKAPKFEGLRAACVALGINGAMNIPGNAVWADQEAVANAVADAATREGKFATAWGTEVPYNEGLGSVMFIKGEAGYNAWREDIAIK